MDERELKRRTKVFALTIMKMIDDLPKTAAGRAIGNQLIRSATSIGANYRAACRGRSRKEFACKIGIAEEEADESAYWLELIAEGGLLAKPLVRPVWKEADELLRIMIASRKSARRGLSIENRKFSIENQNGAL